MEAILDNLTPEEIEFFGNTPVLPPPPGIKSNFVDPPSQGPIAIWTTSILIAVALFFYLNRMYIKARLMKSWTWDDLTLTLAMACGMLGYALQIWGCAMGILGRHFWDISLSQILSLKAQRVFYMVFIIQPWMLLFLKLTFFILYLHLFHNVRWARISSWAGLIFATVTQGAIGIISFVVGRPNDSIAYEQWTAPIGVALGSVGLVIDLAIFIIPYIVIAGLQLSRTKRIGAYIIFLTGGCAIVCSAINIYFRSKMQHEEDLMWYEIRPAIAAVAEIFLGVACACVPSFSYGLRHEGSIYQKVFRRGSSHSRPRRIAELPNSIQFQKLDGRKESTNSSSYLNTTLVRSYP